MNYNPNTSTSNAGMSGLGRKPKRVSDVGALGMGAMSAGGMPAPTGFPQTPYDSSFGGNMTQNNPTNFNGNGFEQNNYGYNTPVSNASYPQYIPGGGFNSQAPVTAPFPQAAAQFGNMLQQPIVQDMAMQYGQQLANQGKSMVNREIEKYVPVSRLKYYFAVDTKYVIKKLLLIFFPYTHKDWSVKYEQEHPVQPRYELNAPDLYIPTMAYVTYVVLAGFVLGMQHRFSPEQIGIQASSALAYSILEICLYLATLYVTNIQTSLTTFDLVSFSGYKYVTIIAATVSSLIFKKLGYYIALVCCSFSLAFFLVRTLKVQVLIEPSTQNEGYPQDAYSHQRNSGGSKRRVYFLLFVAVMQPIFSWWLTCHLIPSTASVITPVEPTL